MIVIKRDGREVEFDKTKISDAILKAMEDVGEIKRDIALRIANDISKLDCEKIEVEKIQNLIENKLMNSHLKEVAKRYIRYRYDREKIRESKSQLIKDITDKLMATNVQNQNANVDEKSFGGRMGEANSVVMKNYALNYCMSEMAKNNHLNNEIYIHDLDSYAVGMHNCLSIPFDKLLAEGFNTRQTDVRPAQSVSTAFQLVAVIFQLQSLQQFGGVSATHLDWTMVPYVRKSFYKHFKDGCQYILHYDVVNMADFEMEYIHKNSPIDDKYYKESQYEEAYEYAMDMTIKEVKQAVEGLYHNLNTLQSRSGNQLNTRWLAT